MLANHLFDLRLGHRRRRRSLTAAQPDRRVSISAPARRCRSPQLVTKLLHAPAPPSQGTSSTTSSASPHLRARCCASSRPAKSRRAELTSAHHPAAAYYVPAGTRRSVPSCKFSSRSDRSAPRCWWSTSTAELQDAAVARGTSSQNGRVHHPARPGGSDGYQRPETDGSIVVDGMTPLRDSTGSSARRFRSTGPKTLNGLIVGPASRFPMPGRGSASPVNRSKSCRCRTAPSRS